MTTTAVEHNRNSLASTITRALDFGRASSRWVADQLTSLSQKICIVAKCVFAGLAIACAATLVLAEIGICLIPGVTTIVFLPQAINCHMESRRIRGISEEDRSRQQILWKTARSAYLRAIPLIGNGIVVYELGRSVILGVCCPL